MAQILMRLIGVVLLGVSDFGLIYAFRQWLSVTMRTLLAFGIALCGSFGLTMLFVANWGNFVLLSVIALVTTLGVASGVNLDQTYRVNRVLTYRTRANEAEKNGILAQAEFNRKVAMSFQKSLGRLKFFKEKGSKATEKGFHIITGSNTSNLLDGD